jgi:glycosyltransferase involved in cell wall biosynthesis
MIATTTDKPTVFHMIVPEPDGEIGGAQHRRGEWRPCVAITQNSSFAKRLEQAGIDLVPGHQCRSWRSRFTLLSKYFLAVGPTILHSHGYDADYLAFFQRCVHRRTWGRVPTIMTCHGWVEDSWNHRFKTGVNFLVYRSADGLICCAPTQPDRLRSLQSRAVIQYIPNGVHIPDSASLPPPHAFREQYALAEELRLVAYVGRLAPEKRIDLYLQACQRIAIHHRNVHFIVVGSGPCRARLEHLATELNLRDRVTFTGMISSIHDVYPHLAMLILTSDTEGTSRVALEAMSHGVPVIATRVGGIPALIRSGHDGFLVEAGDYVAVAERAMFLLQAEDVRTRLGRSAAQRVADNFTIDEMERRVAGVYHQVLTRINGVVAAEGNRP